MIGIILCFEPTTVKDLVGIWKDMHRDPPHYRTVLSQYRLTGFALIIILNIWLWPVALYGVVRRGK